MTRAPAAPHRASLAHSRSRSGARARSAARRVQEAVNPGSGAASGVQVALRAEAVRAEAAPALWLRDPPPYSPAPGMLRRLTRAQFRNAVRDVFGVEVDLQALDADSYNGEFATVGATTVVVSTARGRAISGGHRAGRGRCFRGRDETSRVHRLHPERVRRATLCARFPRGPRPPRLAAPPRSRRARSTRRGRGPGRERAR